MSLVPSAWALVISGVGGTLAYKYLPTFVASLLGAGGSWAAQAAISVATFVVTALGILFAIVLGLILAQPLSGPILERLARAFEAEIGAPYRPIVPLWRQVGRSAGGVLIGLAAGLPVLLALVLITMAIPVTVWVTTPLKLLVFGMMVTWDLMDYPFTVRGWSLRMRATWMRENLAAVAGFGISLGIVLIIPCVGVLLLPIGAVGATWLYHDRARALPPADSELQTSD
jgi:CysZ protein